MINIECCQVTFKWEEFRVVMLGPCLRIQLINHIHSGLVNLSSNLNPTNGKQSKSKQHASLTKPVNLPSDSYQPYIPLTKVHTSCHYKTFPQDRCTAKLHRTSNIPGYTDNPGAAHVRVCISQLHKWGESYGSDPSIKLRGWTEFLQLKSFLQSNSGLLPCPGCTDLCDLDVFSDWSTIIQNQFSDPDFLVLISCSSSLKTNEKDFAGILGKGYIWLYKNEIIL